MADQLAAPTTLDELCELLRERLSWTGAPRSAAEHGVDWTSLPTFGGPAPDDTDGVQSWDDRRLLVGMSADTLQIIDRELPDFVPEHMADGWCAWCEYEGENPHDDDSTLWDRCEDAWRGEWDGELDYAEEFVGEVLFASLEGIDDDHVLARYFNIEAYCRDLFIDDVYSLPAPDGGVFVFLRNV